MYTSDLARFLRMLKETRANGVFATEWAGPGEPWHAQLILLDGQVTFCTIQSSVDGYSLLTDSEAIHWLANLGNLQWEQVPSLPQQPSQSLLHASQAVLLSPIEVPQRLIQVEKGAIDAWPRKHRQVFALVDGHRSIERIADILRQPLHVVEDTLQDLQAKGVIALNGITEQLRKKEGIA